MDIYVLYFIFTIAHGADALTTTSSTKKSVVKAAAGVGAILSILSILMVLGVWAFNKKKGFVASTKKISFCLMVTDFGIALSWLLDFVDTDCRVMGLVKLYFVFSSVMWTWIISISVAAAVNTPNRVLKWLSKTNIQHILGWGAPIPSVVALAAIKSSASNNYWCWVRPEPLWARIVIFDFPTAIIGTTSVCIYIWALRYLLNFRKQSPATEISKPRNRAFTRLRLIFFLLTNLLSWTWIFLSDITEQGKEGGADSLYIMAAMLCPLQGMGNCFIVGLDYSPKSETSSEAETPPVSTNKMTKLAVSKPVVRKMSEASQVA